MPISLGTSASGGGASETESDEDATTVPQPRGNAELLARNMHRLFMEQ